MATYNQPLSIQVRRFVEGHLGKGAFAPLTGQDMRAWVAFVHLLEMYGVSDLVGRDAAIVAMAAVLRGVQNLEQVHRVFVQAIPRVLDWGDADRIWPKLGSNWHVVAIDRRTIPHN